jgi:hypothetical protein
MQIKSWQIALAGLVIQVVSILGLFLLTFNPRLLIPIFIAGILFMLFYNNKTLKIASVLSIILSIIVWYIIYIEGVIILTTLLFFIPFSLIAAVHYFWKKV